MIQPFIASFVLVLTRGFQQLNVIHSLYVPAFFTSFVIACGEVGVIMSGVQYGWSAVPWIGFGGGLGVICAMLLHKKVFKK
ncbi:MAG: hypothetical protein DRQ43_06075 [Gammaproteobacteria bacterium]|nr:MAG: hypothetical protein DRQ43_06075 [Gammaproteobacteria bacterium]